MSADLRLGDWRDVLAGVEVDCVMSDPPYSARTQDGHDAAIAPERLAGEEKRMRVDRRNGAVYSVGVSRRRRLQYSHWTPDDVDAFVDSWAPRCRGWMVCLSDHTLCSAYESAFETNGLTSFAPVGILIPGMTVRMCGDGPSSWMLYANVARPKRLSKWGTLPGGYTGGPGERIHIGGKPLWLMRALIRDYTKPGDLVCDPCAGAATTLLAARMENRKAIGAEIDPETHAVGAKRLAAGYTPSFDFEPVKP